MVQMRRHFRRRYDEGRRMIVRDSVEDGSIGNNLDQTRLTHDHGP